MMQRISAQIQLHHPAAAFSALQQGPPLTRRSSREKIIFLWLPSGLPPPQEQQRNNYFYFVCTAAFLCKARKDAS